MTPEEIAALQAKIGTLEAALKKATDDLAAEKQRASAPRLGATSRQVEALQEELSELRKELAALKTAKPADPKPADPKPETTPAKKASALKDR